MIWDTHMHTHFSSDSTADIHEMIAAARNAGVGGICFTDHMDVDYPCDKPETFFFDLPEYYEEMKRIQTQYQRSFPIRIGMELGLQPHLKDKLPQITEAYPLDFVIGSSHLVNHMDPYYPEFFQGKEEADAYREYFESILENLTFFDCFDVYGHIDYIVRYGPNTNKFYSYETYSDVIDEILRTLIQKGKGIEINTAGFKYGLGHPHPTEQILSRYHALGGEILTIGADAHKPEHVAYGFHKVPGILKEAGFRYFTVFEGRKPEFYPL
ncbi:histidinol-phosphatase HisJ family protein [Lachnospiraceae bacterium 29-84]